MNFLIFMGLIHFQKISAFDCERTRATRARWDTLLRAHEATLSDYKKMAEEEILKLGVHPGRAIEKYRKTFPLEDLPKIITFDFIQTHFGNEQLEIYKRILRDGRLK